VVEAWDGARWVGVRLDTGDTFEDMDSWLPLLWGEGRPRGCPAEITDIRYPEPRGTQQLALYLSASNVREAFWIAGPFPVAGGVPAHLPYSSPGSHRGPDDQHAAQPGGASHVRILCRFSWPLPSAIPVFPMAWESSSGSDPGYGVRRVLDRLRLLLVPACRSF